MTIRPPQDATERLADSLVALHKSAGEAGVSESVRVRKATRDAQLEYLRAFHPAAAEAYEFMHKAELES